MSQQPPRMRDEGATPLERALLDAGSSSGMSPATRARTLAALGVTGSLAASAVAAQAAGVAGSQVARAVRMKLLAAVTALGAAAAVPAGYYAWQHRHHAAASTTAPAARAAEPVLPEVEALPSPTGTRAGGSAASSAAAAASATLAQELMALDGARARLARGDADGALSALAAYNRSHPRGRLQPEAEVLRIDALAASGRRDEARRRAHDFLRSHPGDLLAGRVRRVLED